MRKSIIEREIRGAGNHEMSCVATDNTVRSQIKSIFSKTGVRRQSDLVRLLLSNLQSTIR
jgi:hypothetical protein